MTATRDGKEVSAYVDAKSYAASVHADLDCTDCHEDAELVDDEHPERPQARRLRLVPRGRRQAAHRPASTARRWPRATPWRRSCADCHGTHAHPVAHRPEVTPTSVMNIPLLCGTCHHEGIAGLAHARHPAGPHLRELLAEHPRRGPLPEGAHRHGRLHVVPHVAPDPAAHGPALEHQRRRTSWRRARAATARSSGSTASSSTASSGRRSRTRSPSASSATRRTSTAARSRGRARSAARSAWTATPTRISDAWSATARPSRST